MPPRDELLLIVDLTASIIRAGVGVHDLIRAPLVECSTRIGRRRTDGPPQVADYVVGKLFIAAEAAGEDLEVVFPMVVTRFGLDVVDWTGLEALFRYIFHIGLAIPRPPLAHPVLLSLPAHLPHSVVDQFHAFLFERLLVPQLLVNTRPFFAAASAGVLDAVVLDIGARGEGSEVSVIHDSNMVESATMRVALDEGNLDDWLMLQLLLADPDLPRKLSATVELSGAGLRKVLGAVILSLKEQEAIAFSSPLLSLPVVSAVPVEEEEEAFDIAKIVVEGKVDKIIGKKGDKKKKGKGVEEDTEHVEVPHPLDTEAEPIRVGLVRHRYLEPLFLPHILVELKPSASPAAALLGLEEYETKEVLYSGVQEIMGVVVDSVDDVEVRRTIWDGVVVVSTGKVAAIKALGPALIPLLGAYAVDADVGSETQTRVLRYVRVPDYFSEFKERGGELGCYLGGCIVAKILISDAQSKLFMTKTDYSTKGPAYYRLLDML